MAVLGGSVVVLMVGLVRGRAVQRVVVPVLTAVTLLIAIGLSVWIWEPGDQAPTVVGALTADTLAVGLSVLFYVAGLFAVLLSVRATAVREAGAGEYHSLLLASIAGMVVLAGRGEPDRALRRASSCSRSPCTCCARASCAAPPRWSRG